MNRVFGALGVMLLMGARDAGAQFPPPEVHVNGEMNVMIAPGPGVDGAVQPLLGLAQGAAFDFVTTPLGIGGDVVVGRPYSGEAVTEFVQMLADGNRIVRQSSVSVYRDANGRTRREMGLAVLGNAVGGANRRNQVQIQDPQSGTMFMLDVERRVAHQLPSPKIMFAPAVKALAGPESTFELPLPPPPVAGGGAVFFQRGIAMQSKAPNVEQLGKMTIEGVEAEGTRSTVTIPAGQVGNDQPITVISERWFSPELQVLLMSRQSDPRFGETTYRLTSIVRAEPSPDLFVVPPDFKIVESPVMGIQKRIERSLP